MHLLSRYWHFAIGTLSLIFISLSASAQQPKKLVQQTLDAVANRAHMEFLASDELRGRDTGSQELKIAAKYLAVQLKSYGVKGLESAEEGYYQPVYLKRTSMPSEVNVTFNPEIPVPSERIAVFKGDRQTVSGEVEFLPDGLAKNGRQVKGKILLLNGGKGVPPKHRGMEWMQISEAKYKKAVENGAAAVIELYHHPDIRWQSVRSSLSRVRLKLDKSNGNGEQKNIPHLLLFDPDSALAKKFSRQKNIKVDIDLKGGSNEKFKSRNVAGMVEGTDPDLKNEFVLLTAHYDHIGISSNVAAGQDSINNGARDNGIGIVALLNAAKNIARYPLKRSVLFLFVTAEEQGLLGSKWYVEHPLIPLKQIIYNLNIDGAGYNDTTKVVVVGLNRTSAKSHFIEASRAFGLSVTPSPQPELNLFYRSDNINFARRGIPAPTFTQGFTAFDRQIQKYYHQPADEVSSLNYNYLNKYYSAFTLSVRLIANDAERPTWLEEEEFQKAYRELYE